MTIAQQLQVTKFPFEINDENGHMIYWEDSNGYWAKRKYDANGNRIYYETSTGYLSRREFDANGIMIYSEDSRGRIMNNRPKPEIQRAIDLLTEKGYFVGDCKI